MSGCVGRAAQGRVHGDAAQPFDDFIDAPRRHANGLGQRVQADAYGLEPVLQKDDAGMDERDFAGHLETPSVVIGNFDAAGVAVMPDEADAPHEFIRQIIIHMKLTWDEAKRQVTLAHRGLDFADAALVFSGPVVEWEDGMRKANEREQTRFGQ